MSEPANECRSEHQLQLQWLQQEVQRQGRELDAVTTKLHEQKHALDALKAQLAVVMGSWRSDVRRDLGSLIREIDATNDTRLQWEQLRHQVDIASPDFARHAATVGAELTGIESKVWMLMGMKLSTAEIANVLQQPVARITECRERLSRKLRKLADPDVAAPPVTVEVTPIESTPRRQATARGRR
jgi:chromosome segregation ATPase